MDFPDPDTPLFGTRNVTFAVAGQRILSDVNFEIAPGEIHALVGKQNEGKTTLGKLLLGEAAPTSGFILAGGREYSAIPFGQARRLGIEGVGSVAKVYPEFSVMENLLTGTATWWGGFGLWRGVAGRIEKWLSGHGIELPLREPLNRLKREDWLFVELLNRLYRRPQLLILDETLEQLRPECFREARLVIDTLRREGMGVLWITHKLEEALDTADRITVLRHGKTLYSDVTRILDRLSLLRLCYAELGEQEGEEVTREQFYELMNLMEAVLRDLPEAVVVSDMEGRVRFCNNSARKMFPTCRNPHGVPLGEFFGADNQVLLDLFAAWDTHAENREWHSQPASTGEGRERLVDVRARVIQEREVEIGHMAIIEDVTVREEMRRNFAVSENLASIGLLAAGVAHEVNDPLAIISNYLGFIRNEAPDQQIVSAANLAQEETVRIHQIVDNLVAFSGNAGPNEELVDVAHLAKELCRLLRFHDRGRASRLICRASEAPLMVRADPTEMRQVLLNLIRNSLDAVGENGEIRVELGRECWESGEEWVKLVISDNGPGIQLANPNDVFKPFVTTKKGKGTHQGLGLSIVYGLVEKYEGEIQARNLTAGGCEFVLHFPRVY